MVMGVKHNLTSLVNKISSAVGSIAGAVKDFGQSVKNKVLHGVYGTNNDPEVMGAVFENKYNSLKKRGELSQMSTEALLMTFNSIKQQGTTLSPEMIREYEGLLEKYNEEVFNGSAGNFQTAGYDPDDGPGIVMAGHSDMQHGKTMKRTNPEVVQPYPFKTNPRSMISGQWAEQSANISTNRGTSIAGFGQIVEDTTQFVENNRTYLHAVSNENQALTNLVIYCIDKTLNSGDLSEMNPDGLDNQVRNYKYIGSNGGSSLTRGDGFSVYSNQPTFELKGNSIEQ